MQIFQGLSQLPAPLSSSVVTIGNFDGVHRGHQELIARLLHASRRWSAEPVAVTFNPHPARVLTPQKPVLRLFDFEDQRERLSLLGVKVLIEEPFTPALARVTAAEFFEKWIRQPLHPKALIVGHDFAFGADRGGRQDFLRDACLHHGIELEIVPAVVIEGAPVSSSRIREALTQGEVDVAAHLLGRPYYLKGEVIAGEKRGRQIGVPTANMRPLMEFTPRQGVYITRTLVGSQHFVSVTNLGINPTFHSEPGAPIKVETHLLDFAGDLYGRELRVELLKFLRPERKFSGIDELKTQIDADMAETRRFFDESP
ncbi:MAG: bifunctional riboflavin kinase/FAD synthetase [Bdellovibrionaceae bacterium]|nr:bifunctional riboflavin kinase/FAD synthetase [Pseudobdellovibrionaceae bacterium]